MSIKDLFGKRSNQILTVEKYEETVKRDGESSKHVDERNIDQTRFVPRISVDFDDPKTFARYGSAEKYYIDAINSVLNTYPYDGSLAEKTAWHNNATYIDNYIFENEYPRTTGYVKFNDAEAHPQMGVLDGYRYLQNSQFIYVKGGPNPTPINETGELRKEYPEGLGKSNIWNPEMQRESNLFCDGTLGNTVEFWFKLDEERADIDGSICLFDLWNNRDIDAEQYCRFLVQMPEDKDSDKNLVNVTYVSGSAGATDVAIGSREVLPSSLNLNSWNHFSVSAFNADDAIVFRLYINGEMVDEVSDGTVVGSFVGETNHLTATLGALQYKTDPASEENFYGFASARASYDEFRFWKSVRTSEQIGRNWFTQVHGGANSDEPNTDLGVYYKFNEGTYNSEKISPFDVQVLDYSGRVSNGSIVNYSLLVRDSGSAIDEKPGVNNTEYKDPIVYRTHPSVQELMEEKRLEGNSHDMTNNSAVYNTMPEWITTADEEGTQGLLGLSQIISSYFDTLHLQIEALPSITNTHYVQDGEKPLPFAKHLLESVGFVAPEIFVDTTILEALSNRNEERVFEEKLHNVKNLIYQNVYNNIVGIYKAKGTEKSFRNLLRCFGVGDELIKINLYGDGVTHRLKDSYRSVSVKKNFLDFNDVDRHDSTVYQTLEPDNPHSVSYIAGTDDGGLDFIPFTMQTTVIFPKKLPIDHPNYYQMDFGFTDERPSSIFGMHQAKDAQEDLTWVDAPDFGFRVVSIKEKDRSPKAKFRLDVRGFGFAPNADNEYHEGVFETEFFHDVYDNTRWNFAVRVRTDKRPDLVYKSDENVKYFLEFYGISTILDQTQEEFLFEAELDAAAAKSALNANKRLFLGAEYRDTNDNSEGTVNQSDVKIGEVRYWQDYLDNETIKYHAQDPDNYGVRDPYKSAYFEQQSVGPRVPQIDTLCLYWDFATVTLSSVSDGVDGIMDILSDSFFYVDDVSIGSNEEAAPTGRYGWIGNTVKRQHTGKGDYYYPEDRHVVDKNFLFAAKQNLPEIIGSTDTIQLLTQDDDRFVKNIRPVNYFWAVEKSMYQAISQEIVHAFAGIKTFNNLIGEPVNRYRMEYKNLNKLRQLFFQRFEEAPRVEKYIQFYKWIDNSISEMIKQLIPASANFSDDMRTMIESHVLERNKYWTKFPTLEMKQKPPETAVLGINEMLYNWKFGHASMEEDEAQKCLWWKERAERDGVLQTGDEDVDDARAQILHVATTKNSGDYIEKKLAHEVGGITRSYDGQTFALRSLSTPYRFGMEVQKSIHGGVNNKKNKKIDYVRAELADRGVVEVRETTQAANSVCLDEELRGNPLFNKRLNIEAGGSNGSSYSLYELNENILTGETYWNSNHSDTYGEDKDVPLQGIFPSVNVGGLQSRHVFPFLHPRDLDEGERPEAWNFESGTFYPLSDEQPKATYYRDEKAKRPVNIRNIKSSYGNYQFDYEVVQTSGRSLNNRWLVEQEGLDEMSTYSTESDYVVGMYDFTLPDRGRNEHIFVERFSSPGGPDTLSRGMMDVEAEEFAVYNSLNFRNLDVRTHLANWLTYHTKRWGYRSYYRGRPVDDCESPGDLEVFCEANYHKNHRNTAYRPEAFSHIDAFENEIPEEVDPCCECDEEEYARRILTDYRCKETHDNFWVTHQLPRSGYQYSWINSSTRREIFEEVEGEAVRYTVCPWGYATQYPNAVAYHPETATSPTEFVGEVSAYGKSVVKKKQGQVIIEEGFPFLNTFISYDDESGHHPKTYEDVVDESFDRGCSEISSMSAIRGLDINSEDTFAILDPSNEDGLSLNDMLLHRDGPYQHPSWKQIRNFENKIVVNQRKNNIFSMVDLPKEIRVQGVNKFVTFRETRAQTAQSYVEPAVSWNLPMRHKMQFPGSPSSGVVVHSYSNNVEVFSNPYLDKRMGLKKTAKQIYDVLVEKYASDERNTPEMFEMIYSEYIFPKHRNATLDKTRRRRFYKEESGQNGYDRRSSMIRTFWAADGLRERTRYSYNEERFAGRNAFGEPVRRSSVWALEYAPQERLLSGDFSDGGNIALRGDLAWAGLPQYSGYTSQGQQPQEKDDMEKGLEVWMAPRPRLQFIHNPHAPDGEGREYAWKWKAAEISNNTPWHDDYDEYSKDIRLIGQNYTLTPEYNVSSHLEFYINDNAGNFLAENKRILELPGVHPELEFSGQRYESTRGAGYYFSWDGTTSMKETLDLDTGTLIQPNFANGYDDFAPGKVSGLELLDKEDNDYGEAHRILDSYVNIEPPASLDTNIIKGNWKCGEEYPVGTFVKGMTFQLDFAKFIENQNLRSVSKEGFAFAKGLPLSPAQKALPYWNPAVETSGNANKILSLWDSVVFTSCWFNFRGSTGKSVIYEFTSGTIASGEPESQLLEVDGTVYDLRVELESLRQYDRQWEALSSRRAQRRLITAMNSATRRSLDRSIDTLTQEMNRITPLMNSKKSLIQKLMDVNKKFQTLPARRIVESRLYLDHEKTLIVWEDNVGNKLYFGEFDDYAKIMNDGWSNISVCYVGGYVTEGSSTDRHKVLLFVNGVRVLSTQDKECLQAAKIINPAENVRTHDGSLFYDAFFPAAFSTMKLGTFNGKATDLVLYRGNPGIVNAAWDESQVRNTPHNSVENQWFFDVDFEEYYGKKNPAEPTSGEDNAPAGSTFVSAFASDVRCTLAEIIYENQCENPNEVFAEWRDFVNACKIKEKVDEGVQSEEFRGFKLQFNIVEAADLQPFDLTGLGSDLASQAQAAVQLQEQVTSGIITTGLGNNGNPLGIPRISPNEVEGFQSAFSSLQTPAQVVIEAEEELSQLEDITEIADVVDGSSPEEDSTDITELISTAADTIGNQQIEQDANSACAELIGWWRIGVPFHESPRCEEYVWKEDFFKCYSHTDKISHIEKIREDHKALKQEGTDLMMRLEVSAIKKLLPYNGFYPSQRAVQLGSLFYDSVVKDHVTGENDNQRFSRARTEQAALQPFFAPGILFNAIKSGMAVDWAAFAGNQQSDLETYYKLEQPPLVIPEINTDDYLVLKDFIRTPAFNVIQGAVARDLSMAESIGRVRTEEERTAFTRESYNRNIGIFGDELTALSDQVQNECTQQEYERFAEDGGYELGSPQLLQRFREAYSCPEFVPNTAARTPLTGDSLLGRVLPDSLITSATTEVMLQQISKMNETKNTLVRVINNLTYTREVKTRSYISTSTRMLTKTPSFRIPFEALVSLGSYIPQTNSAEQSKIFFLAPSYYNNVEEADVQPEYPYFEWTGNQNPLYEMAMNNFLAEVPNFFLRGGKFTTFASSPENKFKTVKAGWTYYMDVHLYKTNNFDMVYSPHDGERLRIGRADSSGNEFTTHGRYFGPPMQYLTDAEMNDKEVSFMPSADPAQAAYVPPYFYGRAKARLKFVAQRDGQPTLEEILNNLEIDYINEEMDSLFSSRSSSEQVSGGELLRTIQDYAWKKVPAYEARMPMEACIKFDGKANEKKTSFAAINTAYDYSPDGVARLAPQRVEDDVAGGTGVWVISPRFECPTFNFKSESNLNYIADSDQPCGTGIWGGYGTIPSNQEGIFISLEESFKRHEKPNQPLTCKITNEEIFAVALGIQNDVRLMHENVITLEDPFGGIEAVTIGQPTNAEQISPWGQEAIDKDVSAYLDLGFLDSELEERRTPFSSAAKIRTSLTSPSEKLGGNQPSKMSGQYDIEAYLEAEKWQTDMFSVWNESGATVPLASDVANAIEYHINYLYKRFPKSFPWKASVVWVHPNDYQNGKVRGSAKKAGEEQLKKYPEYNKLQTVLQAIVQIEYDYSRAPTGAKKVNETPKVSLSVNQDSIKNPNGRLGIRYLTETSALDWTRDRFEPELQENRDFYRISSTRKIIDCIQTVGSLIDVCGFTATKSRIGEVAASKEISEAVIMIPFVDNPIIADDVASTTQVGGRNFFKISEQLFAETFANVAAGEPAIVQGKTYNVAADIPETSVSEMIKKLQKYNMPPQYDFLKYRQISPFVTYVFEFSDELNSDDLSNIWQGLMPQRAKVAEQDTEIIQHELNEVNFFEGKKVPENVRWIVFRAKKKAKTNYWEMTADSVDDDRFKFDFTFGTDLKPDYSYNWPYDFCSLVELCRVKGGISVTPKLSADNLRLDPILSEVEKQKIISDAHSQAAVTRNIQAVGLTNWEGDE